MLFVFARNLKHKEKKEVKIYSRNVGRVAYADTDGATMFFCIFVFEMKQIQEFEPHRCQHFGLCIVPTFSVEYLSIVRLFMSIIAKFATAVYVRYKQTRALNRAMKDGRGMVNK